MMDCVDCGGSGADQLSKGRGSQKITVSWEGNVFDLDGIPIPSLLVEQGGRHAAKPVPGHFRAAPAEPPQAAVDGVLAHAPLAAARARKDVAPFAGQWLQSVNRVVKLSIV